MAAASRAANESPVHLRHLARGDEGVLYTHRIRVSLDGAWRVGVGGWREASEQRTDELHPCHWRRCTTRCLGSDSNGTRSLVPPNVGAAQQPAGGSISPPQSPRRSGVRRVQRSSLRQPARHPTRRALPRPTRLFPEPDAAERDAPRAAERDAPGGAAGDTRPVPEAVHYCPQEEIRECCREWAPLSSAPEHPASSSGRFANSCLNRRPDDQLSMHAESGWCRPVLGQPPDPDCPE